MLRVFIVDDHPILAMALRDLLCSRYPDLEVKLFSRLTPALEHANFEQPDMVILDPGLPEGAPEQNIELALDALQETTLIVLSGNDQVLEEVAPRYLNLEFLSKSVSQDRLFSILETSLNQVRRASWAHHMAEKQNNPSHAAAQEMAISQRISRITDRQIIVLHRIAKGESNHEIARALNLSPETVKTHVRSILARLNARNRLEAAMLYRSWKEPKNIGEAILK